MASSVQTRSLRGEGHYWSVAVTRCLSSHIQLGGGPVGVCGGQGHLPGQSGTLSSGRCRLLGGAFLCHSQ